MRRTTRELVEVAGRTSSLSYAPQPVVLERGEGMWLEDREGERYLDFMAGIAVSSLGHAHPALMEALHGQVDRLLHVSNAFLTEPQVLLQEALVQASFADRVFFCNSGAEANEAGIKLARRYQRIVRGSSRFEVVVFARGFHGRTYGALSATAQPKYHRGFEPMVPGFVEAEFNDLESVKGAIGPHTAAILVEPIQGEGGIVPPCDGFLAGLRTLCDENGLVLIFDEVQCGMGRTGHLFAYEGFGVEPDIMSLAKGIGGGVPLGAMLARESVARGFERGSHATTYGGNPLAAAAGLAVLHVLQEDGFLERVRDVGAYFRARAEEAKSRCPGIREVRGLGLMNGIEVDLEATAASAVVVAARRQGLLINTAGGNVLRFVPPLIATRRDVDEAFRRLLKALGDTETVAGHD
ncbi:MAG: aspartate aminotransferase family protein [Deltaproteobacteria bacterium]|nr:MAG: aspartate aminotransferase family protein [Deltaproteobacteria bacterium]